VRDPSKGGAGARAAYRKIRQKVPMVRKDRPIAADIEVVATMISDGSLLEAVESSVGKLR
jgi:histidine ammonia-lyase